MVWIEDRPLDCIEAHVRVRWHFLLDYLCFCPAPRARKELCFLDLAARYRRADRYYHTLHHLGEMIDLLLRMLSRAPRLETLGLAVFFHDVIYDTSATDNEEQSAEYAAETMSTLQLPQEETAEVQRLILLTKRHETTPDDHNGQLLIDADLAILGASPSRYAAYARAIRQEYFWVPEERFRLARGEILRRVLSRDRIFTTDLLYLHREDRARRNMQRELAELERE